MGARSHRLAAGIAPPGSRSPRWQCQGAEAIGSCCAGGAAEAACPAAIQPVPLSVGGDALRDEVVGAVVDLAVSGHRIQEVLSIQRQ